MKSSHNASSDVVENKTQPYRQRTQNRFARIVLIDAVTFFKIMCIHSRLLIYNKIKRKADCIGQNQKRNTDWRTDAQEKERQNSGTCMFQ